MKPKLLVVTVACLIAAVPQAHALSGGILAQYFYSGSENGDVVAAANFFFNGVPIPGTDGTLELFPGDVFRFELSASGTSGAMPGSGSGVLTLTASTSFPATDSLIVRAMIDVDVDASGIDAFSNGGLNFNCFAMEGCWALTRPPGTEVSGNRIITDTIGGNVLVIDDDIIELLRVGGPETYQQSWDFLADDPPGPLDEATIFLEIPYIFAAISSTASVDLAFEVTVIPIPAAAFLFPAGLIAGIGWMRRNRAV